MKHFHAVLMAALSFSPGAFAAEEGRLFHHIEADIDYADWGEAQRLVTWDAGAWYGGDTDKVWVKSEGEWSDGDLESAELQLRYSRMISRFWDLQAGIRHDFRPTALTYAALGLHGLAPHFVETDLDLFLSEDGDAHLRLDGDISFLLTQRLRLTPFAEMEIFLQDVEELERASGPAVLETGLQLAYEIEREFAPYLELNFETGLGATRSHLRAAGEDEETLTLRAGLHFWLN